MTASSTEHPVFAIGDVHGHLDRLEALLKQEGLVEWCQDCEGSGQIYEGCGCSACEYARFGEIDCLNCHGTGWARSRRDVVVVQLGDLGHFGVTGSPTGDDMCYQFGAQWCDVILWGNHDRAVRHSSHAFGGYLRPLPETVHRMGLLRLEGRQKLAYAAHGFLLTHAGLAKAFKQNKVEEPLKQDPVLLAEWLNALDMTDDTWLPIDFKAIRDAIGARRGGGSPTGGILWRDAAEKLYGGFNQVFGHSAKDKVRRYHTEAGTSYCIDIGSTTNGKLAGIWLPDERVVEVKV